jgi:hypothetical protein
MKTLIKSVYAIVLMAVVSTAFTSCKKGEDDPALSLRSREARFVNQWTLTRYEKNGQSQDLSGATFIYDTNKDGTLKQTIEGSIFGVATRSIESGTWSFLDDKERVRVSVDSVVEVYDIQRLANSELWLKQIDGSDTYVYQFEGK